MTDNKEVIQIIQMLEEKYIELVKANHWKESNYYLQAIALIKKELK